MLVEGRASGHLVRGDEPFIPTRKDVVGEFSRMNPPRVAIDSHTEKMAFGRSAKSEGWIVLGWLTTIDGTRNETASMGIEMRISSSASELRDHQSSPPTAVVGGTPGSAGFFVDLLNLPRLCIVATAIRRFVSEGIGAKVESPADLEIGTIIQGPHYHHQGGWSISYFRKMGEDRRGRLVGKGWLVVFGQGFGQSRTSGVPLEAGRRW